MGIVAKSNANVTVSAVKLHSIVSYLLVIFVIPHCFTQSTICSSIHITYSEGQNLWKWYVAKDVNCKANHMKDWSVTLS